MIAKVVSQSSGKFALTASALGLLLFTGCVERRVVYVPTYQAQPGYVVSAPVSTNSPANTNAPVVVSVAPTPPPPPHVEVVTVAPGSDYFWVPGYWYWDGRGWLWWGGRWSPRPWHGAVWIGGGWARHSGHWGYRPGHWR